MLEGYKVMPDDDLMEIQPVRLTQPLASIISRPGVKSQCDQYGEEIINQCEIVTEDVTLCISCAGPAYFEFI